MVGNWAVEVTAVASQMLKLVCKHMANNFASPIPLEAGHASEGRCGPARFSIMERLLEKGAKSVALGNPLQIHFGEGTAPPATPVMFNASQDVEHAGVAAVKKPSSSA